MRDLHLKMKLVSRRPHEPDSGIVAPNPKTVNLHMCLAGPGQPPDLDPLNPKLLNPYNSKSLNPYKP